MSKGIAVVTGGMGGIGHAICRELHANGFKVVAGYNRPLSAATEWQSVEREAGYDFDIIHVDVSSYVSCEAAAKKIEQETGPIEVLVNNAGITRDISCCKMNKEDWDLVIHTDLSSIFYMTHAVINGMKTRNYGRIINISSINGQKGQYGQVNYAAAKAGIYGFTKSLALEVAKRGITVNAISPGYVSTDMIMAIPEDIKTKILNEIPLGRFAEPVEIARVVSFLASKNNSYITGANININGGHYMS